jgi:hypothetical protein
VSLSWNRVLLILSFVLFVLAALAAGGVISMGSAGWLVPGGLAALVLAMLLA